MSGGAKWRHDPFLVQQWPEIRIGNNHLKHRVLGFSMAQGSMLIGCAHRWTISSSERAFAGPSGVERKKKNADHVCCVDSMYLLCDPEAAYMREHKAKIHVNTWLSIPFKLSLSSHCLGSVLLGSAHAVVAHSPRVHLACLTSALLSTTSKVLDGFCTQSGRSSMVDHPRPYDELSALMPA